MSFHVLVIDGDRRMARLAETWLRAAQFQVQSTSHIPTAIRQMKTHPPDAILIDVRTARPSLKTVVTQLRQAMGVDKLPAVVQFVASDDKQRQEAVDCDTGPVIGKPYNAPRLVNAVNHVIRARTASHRKAG